MIDRTIRILGVAALTVLLFGAGNAWATVKCQCNNGSITHDMSADYDDDDLDAVCNDACSESGGGRVWKPEVDESDGDDVIIRHPARPAPRN